MGWGVWEGWRGRKKERVWRHGGWRMVQNAKSFSQKVLFVVLSYRDWGNEHRGWIWTGTFYFILSSCIQLQLRIVGGMDWPPPYLGGSDPIFLAIVISSGMGPTGTSPALHFNGWVKLRSFSLDGNEEARNQCCCYWRLEGKPQWGQSHHLEAESRETQRSGGGAPDGLYLKVCSASAISERMNWYITLFKPFEVEVFVASTQKYLYCYRRKDWHGCSVIAIWPSNLTMAPSQKRGDGGFCPRMGCSLQHRRPATEFLDLLFSHFVFSGPGHNDRWHCHFWRQDLQLFFFF